MPLLGEPPTADVVIVGAGSSGCVLAERLSRDPARQVVLVDHGSERWPDPRVRDLTRLPIDPGAMYATQYPEVSGLPVVRGRGLGGSSVINGGYFLRWHQGDFDDWPTGWDVEAVSKSYDEIDGGSGGNGGAMKVSAFADDELGDMSLEFERYWARSYPVRDTNDPWPVVGVNRVRSNRDGGLRMTAAEGFLRPAVARANLTVVAATGVLGLLAQGRRVTGVATQSGEIRCGEVILCAGTLGTAEILLSSGVDAILPESELAVREHREILVEFRAAAPDAPRPLLQSVVHTSNGCEIRCYSDDFAKYIPALPSTSQVIGVAAMSPAGDGTLRMHGGRLIVELLSLDIDVMHGVLSVIDEVVQMLAAPEFAGLVTPGSVAVDPVVRTSQHAWGSMPMGKRTDWLGGVHGVRGLRIVDGSILPTDGRSGPHATTMMMACRIGAHLASR